MDDTPQEDQRPTFKVDLFQTVPEHEVHSETFTVTANSPEEALEKAQGFVSDEKDLEDGTYRLELQPEEEATDGEEPSSEGDNGTPASGS